MIKKYYQYLTENVSLSNDIVIEIIKSLEGDNNAKLVNKLINHTDSKGKTVFMSILQMKNPELIDYALKFDVDLEHKDKYGQNAYFYCKNSETLKTLYNLGIDIKAKSTSNSKKNVLLYLSSAKIYNVDIYKKMIDGGIDINELDEYDNSVLSNSILNKGITQLLINNNTNLNDKSKLMTIKILLETIRWFPKKRRFAINMFKFLFDNGMKIDDNKEFASELNYYWSSYDYLDVITDILYPLRDYVTDDMMLAVWDEYSSRDRKDFFQKFLHEFKDIAFPKLYFKLKTWFDRDFEEYFREYIDEHGYIEDGKKYNL